MSQRVARRILIFSGLLSVALTVPVPVPSAQQSAAPVFQDANALPAGLKGARIRSMIETANSGDPERFRRYFLEECTAEMRNAIPLDDFISSSLDFRRQTGGIDFFSIRTYAPERPADTVVICKDRALGGWVALTFRFGDDPAFLVSRLQVGQARPPAGPAEPPLTEKQALDEIRGLTDGLIKSGWYSGTVLVAKGPDILLAAAGGEADKGDHTKINIDTKFNLGSMNKMFTATAVARLVESGRLSWDDPLSRFVDETWLPKSITDTITIRHLITHTSGLGSYFNEVYDRSSRALFRKLDDYKPLIKDDKPAFPPGERFQYSNTGMFLLGVVIEKVTGEDYFDYIRKTISEPLRMTNTDCYEMDAPVENLAIGYVSDWKSPAKWRNNLYLHVLKGGPAGGGFSTVKDLRQFALGLLSDKLVSRPTREMMWTDFKGGRYGYGFQVVQGPAGKVVGHSGGFPGINSQLDIYVDSGYIVAAMTNIDGASALADRIGRTLARVKK